MSLITRIHGRSERNNSFKIKDKDGNTIAEITQVGEGDSTLKIDTMEGLHIEKPNGWTSAR